MKRSTLAALILGALASVANAQDVTVTAGRPSAVFTPTPGGYTLHQPGPNLSSIPRELNPSGGIPGKPGFPNGRQYRANGAGFFEMAGDYEMPVPKTGQKVPVKAVTEFSKAAMGKALLKAIPLVGTTYAAVELLNEVARAWDAQEPPQPGGQSYADPNTGTVTRTQSEEYWEYGGKKAGSAAGACNAYFSHQEATPGGLVTRTATADLLGPNAYGCRYSHLPASSGYMGSPVLVKTAPVTRHAPAPAYDSVAEQMTAPQVEQLLEEMQSSPNADKLNLQLPSDAPTKVTGPASIPVSTTTTTSSTGTTTTNNTTTNITYQDNRVTITNTTTTTVTKPNAPPETTTTTTEDNTTPDTPPATLPTDDPGAAVTPSTLPPVPDLYEQKYPEGFAGVWNTRSAEIKQGPLFNLLDGLKPEISGGGGCPSWPLNVSIGQWNFGSFDAAPPCNVWPFISAVMMVGALFLARALIFGG